MADVVVVTKTEKDPVAVEYSLAKDGSIISSPSFLLINSKSTKNDNFFFVLPGKNLLLMELEPQFLFQIFSTAFLFVDRFFDPFLSFFLIQSSKFLIDETI